MVKSDPVRPSPFLKWAGGKRQLVEILMENAPDRRSYRRYIEPFLGAGSLFFALAPERGILADANKFLIAAYQAIKDNPITVWEDVCKHLREHSHRHYYETRSEYNRLRHSAAQAARFIYLNKACFNGIFRVNSKGEFNVPKGSREQFTLPSRKEFEAIAHAMANTDLLPADFQDTLALAGRKDFIYLDPPYPALSQTAYFNHYTSDRFDNEKQEKLAELCCELDNRGASFLMSNADVPHIRKLYRRFRLVTIPVKRYVSCKGERTAVSELLIRNY